MSQQGSGTIPVIFAAHGAPMLLEDATWMDELATWAKRLPRPKNVLMISAHWEARPATIGATSSVPLVYDFYGFPERYYKIEYRSPGAVELAARVRALFVAEKMQITDDAKRGLDHGAYVPLIAMYPQADIPVLQLSMPGLDARQLLRMGEVLAPLTQEGTLIFGSGFLTHNMKYAFKTGIPNWAKEFDDWAERSIASFDVDALVDFQARAPGAQLALPTWEHYAPLLVSVGAASKRPGPITFPVTGWWNGSPFTRRSVQFG